MSDVLRLAAGRPWPLGASCDGEGVNFALFSAHATRVELCLVGVGGTDDGKGDGAGGGDIIALDLPECTDGVWHGFLPGGSAGLRYAYRVHGPAPAAPGDRFDPERLLLDPCARRLDGTFSWQAADDRRSAYGLCSVVVDESRAGFDWGDDRPPAIPWADTLLYEVHVRGATMRHPGVPAELRGTYGGLAAPAMLAHYRRLGVTALNLLPVQQHVDEERLARHGLSNYWGYNPIGFFAPHPAYASGGSTTALAEFKAMVRALHAEGIEVIVDVVFNHTAETDADGPTLSWRGIDNRSYYALAAGTGRYLDHTGCGNTFNLAVPRVLQQVMDALRYWVVECHVDGFRFDLATTLVRGSAFLEAMAQDPLLSRVKRIAEPWDMGPDGYRLGRFPPGWSEWNDRCRDTLRGYWLTGVFGAGALAQRLAGSSEVFHRDGRAPQASINYVAAHDGFTLHDLVCYQDKHNLDNGEENRDGHPVNFSTHCGIEGETGDPDVLACRRRLVHALLATLFVTQGVPMLQAGDELGRTQRGNNNAYCQDGELTWTDWAAADTGLTDFVAGLAALRRRHETLRSRVWLSGEPGPDGRPDCRWLHPAGREMSVADWHDAALDAFGWWIAGRCEADADVSAGKADAPDRPGGAGVAGRRAPSADLACLFNRGEADCEFGLPAGDWTVICDTAATAPFLRRPVAGTVRIPGRAVVLLEQLP